MGPTNATLLTNSLTMFVTLTGLQLWTILRYTLHQCSAPADPAIYTPHLSKQQLILRNASSALETARLMLDLAWTNRRSTGKRSRRTYAIGMLAILYALAFMTAGIFSAQVISAPTENGGTAVLLNNQDCGVWNETFLDIVKAGGTISSAVDVDLLAQYNSKREHDFQLSYEYARECYPTQGFTLRNTSPCSILKKSYLKSNNATTSCPFDAAICDPSSETLVLDTGYIDSHDDLGINAKPEERLTYRRITKCTVLNSTSHTKPVYGSGNDSLPIAFHSFFGPSIFENTEWTNSFANYASYYDNFTWQTMGGYEINAQLAYGPADPAWISNDFEPVPELAQSQADIALFFLNYPGTYLEPVDDAWFSAHIPQDFENVSEAFLKTRYAPDVAVSTLGCTEQHQFCTANDICTGILGYNQVRNVNSFNNNLTSHQNATFDRILHAAADSRIGSIVEGAISLTPFTSLLASREAQAGKSGAFISRALPDNQWMLELETWHSVALAHLQRTVAQWATGSVTVDPQKDLLRPELEQDKWFCTNFIVPSSIYKSFSVVAIILVVLIGTLIILISWFVEDVDAGIRRCFGKATRRKHWADDDFLGLQRSGCESEKRPQPLPKDERYSPQPRRSKFFKGLGLTGVDRGCEERKSCCRAFASRKYAPLGTTRRSSHAGRQFQPENFKIPERQLQTRASSSSPDSMLPEKNLDILDMAAGYEKRLPEPRPTAWRYVSPFKPNAVRDDGSIWI